MKRPFLNSINRNTFLFLGGLAGVAHETLLQHSERPTLLILFAAMMGLPAFLTSTEIFPHEHKKNEKEETRTERIEKEAEKDTETRVGAAVEEQKEATHGKD